MYYPHSMFKFVLMGFVLVCLPLFWALVEQNNTVKELAEQSSTSVLRSAEVSGLAQRFYVQADRLERLGLQYLAVEKPETLTNYHAARRVFHDIDTELTARLPAGDTARLAKIRDEEVRLLQRLNNFGAHSAPHEKDAIRADLRAFVENTRSMQDAASNAVLGSVEMLLFNAGVSQEKWQFLLYMSAVAAIILSVSLSIMIARPVLALDKAIRRLGSADFSHKIAVKGAKDFRYLGERLEWLRVRLQLLEDQKNRFLRNMSHELKTPLTSIREGSALLRDGVCGQLSDPQQEIAEIVHENTITLQKMIESLLDFQQQQAQGFSLENVTEQDLSKLVKKVIAQHRLTAQRRGIFFNLRLKPVEICMDSQKVASIVDNLISNAIKFSPNTGKIEVVLTRDAGGVRLTVSDEGPGIPEEDRERVFESFYQGKPPLDEAPIKGSGLGLTIARAYALAHGGTIEVLNRESHKGAQFALWLPHRTGAAKSKFRISTHKGNESATRNG